MSTSLAAPEAVSGGASDPAPGVSAGRMASGSVWALGGLAVGAALQFGYNVGIARVYGAEATGLFAFVLSLTSVAGLLSPLGAKETLLRYVAAYRGVGEDASLRGVLRFGLGLTAAGGVTAALVLWAGADAIAAWSDKPAMAGALRTTAAVVPLVAGATIAAAAFQGARRYREYTLIQDVGRAAAVVVALGVAAAFALPFGRLLELYVGASAVLCAVALTLVVRRLPVRGAPVAYQSRTWLAFSLPVLFLDVFRSASSWLDTLVLGFFLPAAEVGIYFAALRTALLVTIALNAFNAVLTPLAADHWHRGDVPGLNRVFQLTTRWTWMVVLPATVFVMVLRDDLMGLFGAEFAAGGGGLVLLLVLIGRAANGLTGGGGRILVMTGHQRWEILNTALSIGMLVGGLALLVPRYGLVGAAVASSAAMTAVNVLKLVQIRWLVGVQPFAWSFAKPAAATAVAAAAAIAAHALLPPTFAVRTLGVGLTLAVVYAGVLLGLGLDAEDRSALASARRAAQRIVR